MKNSHNTSLFLLSILLFLHLDTCVAVHISQETENHVLFREKIQSRKLLISVNSFSGNIGKMSGSMVEPEKAVENGLKERPPSSSNPIQNKVKERSNVILFP
ncbi:hypothetical protein CDL12_23514 [Handroanthus impetiginosus]|uniref:Non-specific serine/threonine protein kinase n=1 Tax=Handroanthus impetiginosus TaxID=429701 RepID=A0A2G9GF92_9LAMI|nr:hypothetical protein CDL12_23514 [Handroanthus impetiginosus]